MKQLWQLTGKYRYPLGIALVLLLAVFMRFYQLSSLPPGLHADEAANGLDIINILEHHDFRPFYSTNGGREGLFFYLQAIGVQLLGTTTLGLRVVPALLGVLAVGAIYLWLSSWFDRRTALIASMIVAVSPWATTISRDGYRAGMVALMVPLILWLYTKAIQTQHLPWYFAGGATLGLGFYTYPAFWAFPLLLAVLAGHMILRSRTLAQRSLTKVSQSLGATVIVLIPLLWYGFHHMSEFFGRPAGVSVWNTSHGFLDTLQALGTGITKTLLMFHVHGDDNYRHNLGGVPELNVFIGGMFILGILICLVRIKQLRYGGLLALLLIMLLPAMATTEGLPHALRAYGALPAIAGLAALGILHMLDHWRAVFPINGAARMVGSSAMVILLLLTIYQGYTQYFVAWANAPETFKAYREDTSRLAEYYNSHPFSGKRYVVGEQYEMQPVAYLTHHKATYQRLDRKAIDALPIDAETTKEFGVLAGDNQSVTQLQHKFPKLKRSPHYSTFDDRELFTIYTIPAS